jgi:hypothetical protein
MDPKPTSAPTPKPTPKLVKKPYTPPKLTYLGSIREMTLGSATGGASDAKATGRKGT